MIRIFDANDRDFSTAGNVIIEPTKCREFKKKSLNGWYIEVEMPIKYKQYIEQNKLCVIKTKSKLNPQAFRITQNLTFTNRKITFTANHVMFDAENYFLVDVRPTKLNGNNALNYINQRTDNVSPFKIFSNVENVNTAYFIRKSLLEAWTTIEERWNGVFDADNWNISFLQNVGHDNGESIIYGKNMQSMEIFEDWSSVVTKLYPVGYDEIMLPEKYIESDVQYEIPYTRTINFQTEIEQEEQTQEKLIEELRANAEKYIKENKYPKVSYTIVSNINDDMEIGDTIEVLHPLVSIKTEVLEYEYDVISKKVKSLTFGNYNRDVKTKFNNIKETIGKLNETLSNQMSVIKNQTDLINSLNKNGYVYIDENEILILDKIPKSQAKNIWRFGLGGIGFSSNGYEGPFETAITMDGQINAKFITTGTMSVSRIEGLANKISDYDTSISEITLNLGNITQTVSETVTKVETVETQSSKNAQDIDTLKAEAISKVDVEYALGTSTTIAPTSDWNTTAPTWTSDKYMWQRTVTTYPNGSKKISDATCIAGAKGTDGTNGANGKNGEDGIGIKSIQEQYYLSTSNSKQEGGSWKDTQDTWTTGKYIWTRSKITWEDDSVKYTTPVLANGLNTANSTANTAKSTADTAKSTADKANTNADTALEQSKTTSQKVATMEQTVEGFKQSVSSVQETLKTTNTKVENLEKQEIGARNLLQYTGYENTKGVNVRGSYATISIDSTNKCNGNNSLKIVTTASATSGTKDIWQNCWSAQVVGKKIRLSLYVKGSVATKAWFRLAGAGSSISYTTGKFDITTEWKKLEIDLGTVQTAGTQGSTEIIYGFSTAGTFYINSMKLEYGDKTTDWSPAPEDIENTLETNYYTKTETNTQIAQKITDSEASITSSVNKSISTAKTEAINSANQNTANLLKSYSTTTQMNTAIDQKITDSEASITSSVNKTITESIENIEVGGTNLLYNSHFNDDFKSWSNGGNMQVSFGNDTTLGKYLIAKCSNVGDTNTNRFFQFSFATGHNHETGKTYTLSFWAKASQNVGIHAGYVNAVKPFSITTSWEKYSVTYKPSSTGSLTFYIDSANITLNLTKVKLEEGNMPTDWSPAPEDTDEKLKNYSMTTQMNTAITQKITDSEASIKQEITAKVSASEKTLNAKIELKLDTKNLVSQLNASADQISLKAGRLVITAGNFKLDASGNITAVGGTIGGFTISSTYLKGKINGIYNYNNLDLYAAVMGGVGAINIPKKLSLILDANHDSQLDVIDTAAIAKHISESNANNTYKYTGDITINSNNAKYAIRVANETNTMAAMGIGGVYGSSVTCDIFACGSVNSNNKFSGTAISSKQISTNKIDFNNNNNMVGHCYINNELLYGFLNMRDTSGRTYLSIPNGGYTFGNSNDDGKGVSLVTTIRGNNVRLYAHSGGGVYLGSSGSTAVTSDETQKNIYDIDDKYIDFYKKLKPITYIYIKGHRNHIGFGARAVEKALLDSGLTTEQFAGIVKDKNVRMSADEMGTEEDVYFDELYYLRYEEFIALNTMMIQKLQKEVETLKEEVKLLRERGV